MLPTAIIRTPRATWESDSSESPSSETASRATTGSGFQTPPTAQPAATAARGSTDTAEAAPGVGSPGSSRARSHPNPQQHHEPTGHDDTAEVGTPRYGSIAAGGSSAAALLGVSGAPPPSSHHPAEAAPAVAAASPPSLCKPDAAPSAPPLWDPSGSPPQGPAGGGGGACSAAQAEPRARARPLRQSQPSGSFMPGQQAASGSAGRTTSTGAPTSGPTSLVPPLATVERPSASSPAGDRPPGGEPSPADLQWVGGHSASASGTTTAAATLRYRDYRSLCIGGSNSGAAEALDPASSSSCPSAAALPQTAGEGQPVERLPSNDVEALEHDQGVSANGGGPAAAAVGGGDAGDAGGSRCCAKLQQERHLSTHGSRDDMGTVAAAAAATTVTAAVVTAEDVDMDAAPDDDTATDGGGMQAGGSALAPGGAAIAAAALPMTPDPRGPGDVIEGRTPSRLQLSVSVLSPPPQSQSPRLPAADATAAAVGVPVMLLPPSGTADGVAVPNLTVVGRPAAAATTAAPGVVQTGAADGGHIDGLAVLVSEAALDDDEVDAIASITIAATGVSGSSPLRRRVLGSGAVGAAVGDPDDPGEAGPGALPPEVRRRLRNQLGRSRMKRVRTWKDLSYSLAGFRTGYWLVGTLLLVAVLLSEFMFMAGQYEFVRAAEQGSSDSSPSPAPAWGPGALAAWLAFWRRKASRTFDFDYLRVWGGRYAPDLVAGEWWRWLTSLLAHQNSLHLASNLALLLVLSTYLESLYGFWRVLPVFIASGVAGNMVSAFFENPCTLVVGSSGGVFGLLGAYLADAALNFESIPLLWLRLLGMAAIVALIVALQLTGHGGSSGGNSTSHASHVGGFLTGLLLAALLLPDFKARRSRKVRMLLCGLGLGSQLPERSSPGGRQLYSFWQRNKHLSYAVYSIAALALLLLLLGVPLYLYLRTFKRMACG